jgi:hypothetical protein
MTLLIIKKAQEHDIHISAGDSFFPRGGTFESLSKLEFQHGNRGTGTNQRLPIPTYTKFFLSTVSAR